MTARSYLYVPADRPDMIDKAASGAADAFIADLEDGVAGSAKDAARAEVAEWLSRRHSDGRVWLRINNEPGLMEADVAVAAGVGLNQIYLPKATPASTSRAVEHLRSGGLEQPPRIVALVESAEGLAALGELAGIPSVCRLAIGEADLGADLGLDPRLEDEAWVSIRLQLVVASAAARLPAPVGPVLTDYTNDARLRASTTSLRRIGFGARAAIHPRQVTVINEVFKPSDDEVAAARRLVAAFEQAQASGRGVLVTDDGAMADEATVRHARSILEQEDRSGA